MFDLNVTTRVNSEIVRDTYFLEVDFGCALGTSILDSFTFKKESNRDMARLSLYLKFLTYIDKHYKDVTEQFGDEQYEAVKSYMKNDFIGGLSFVDNILYWQPYNYDGGNIMARIDSWTLTYFDKDGIEFNLEIIERGNEDV